MKTLFFTAIVIFSISLLPLNLKSQTWTIYESMHNAFPYSDGTCIATDNNGNIWAGLDKYGEPKGLTMFNGTEWISYDSQNHGMPEVIINHIAFDNNNNVWLSTNQYVIKFNPNGNGTQSDWTIFTETETGFTYDEVNAGLCTQNGDMWFASGGAGILHYDGSNWENHTLPIGCGASSLIWFFHLVEDQNNLIWFSAINRMGSFNPQNSTFEILDLTTGVQLDKVRKIEFDSNYNMWVSLPVSPSYGMAKYDGTSWTEYNTSNTTLVSNNIQDFCIDGNNEIWVSTAGTLTHFDGTNWESWTNVDFMTGYSNFGALEEVTSDGEGNIWAISGNYDFVKLSPDYQSIGDSPHSNQAKIKLWPNPTNGYLNTNQELDNVVVEIYDVNQKLIDLPSTSIYFSQLDLSHLQNGIYFIKFKTMTFIEVHKVIIN